MNAITQPRSMTEAIAATVRDLAEAVSDDRLAELTGIPIGRLTQRLNEPRRLTITDVDRIAGALHMTSIEVVQLAERRMA